MHKILFLFALIGLLISGCTYWEGGKALVKTQGATVTDGELAALEFSYCRLPRIAAVMREFKDKPVRFAAYKVICTSHWVAK